MNTAHSSMSVEDYLKSRCIEIASDITSTANKLEKQLKQEMKEAREELIEVHERCVEGEDGGVTEMEVEEEGSEFYDKENSTHNNTTKNRSSTSKPSITSTSTSAPKSTRKKKSVIPHVSVLIESGPHNNLIAVLKPTAAKAGFAYVGRSTGKKFRESGLSLHKGERKRMNNEQQIGGAKAVENDVEFDLVVE
ncbi:hypothetical protein TrLO_g15596 [Triparma laevis f. longispina]|uniref:Uncharacterized protein n=1 Tax=Triparma laevis f. longispina TaxID=1714387 RepID=A0A9W7FDP6_9STRA|nr:hypothetical protein TrLO_g15596 [Triparma laevis f. longispina]